ncbi:MAG: hypothetical protein F6K17_19055 [Okeania sp. SIO3C4]|nr:hypothetical protein [Okeania sp. SIO3B3]NER04556.1 hypothetical protein [Okeania sp. SIO3C4]
MSATDVHNLGKICCINKFKIIFTEKFWFKASPFKGIINKNFLLSQSSSFQGEVIIHYSLFIIESIINSVTLDIFLVFQFASNKFIDFLKLVDNLLFVEYCLMVIFVVVVRHNKIKIP